MFEADGHECLSSCRLAERSLPTGSRLRSVVDRAKPTQATTTAGKAATIRTTARSLMTDVPAGQLRV